MGDDDEITLDQFAVEVLDQWASFSGMWRRGQASPGEDEMWPEKMRPADWWEQFTQHDPADAFEWVDVTDRVVSEATVEPGRPT